MGDTGAHFLGGALAALCLMNGRHRRVEITFTPTSGTTSKSGGPTAAPTAAPSSDSGASLPSLPAPQGPTAAGPDGVTLTSEGADTSGEVTIALDHVTRAGGFLLGAVTCTVKPGSTGAPLHQFHRLERRD